MLLVDTNVLLDVVTNDPTWSQWSQAQLDAAVAMDTAVVNAVIYAELSLAFDRIEDLEAQLSRTGLRVESIPREALFLAAKVFLQYRRQGGSRSGVLPDFFIGAHAAVLDIALLTRDISRYRKYFPGVRLISPPPVGAT